MTAPTVVVHRDPTALAHAVAARLVTRLVDVQSASADASLLVSGGGIVTASLASLGANPARDAIDWSSLDVWWADDRFLPAGHDERNETQARAALFDQVPPSPRRLHPMPSSDQVSDPETAADQYAQLLATASAPEDHAPVPAFDVALLGVGPDGHVASLFPEMPALYDERAVVAVRGAPKPPPIRLTLTSAALNTAREVWFVVSGADKAGAVSLALSGAGPVQVPAAGVAGRQRTLWLLDKDAAKGVPAGLTRIASP